MPAAAITDERVQYLREMSVITVLYLLTVLRELYHSCVIGVVEYM